MPIKKPTLPPAIRKPSDSAVKASKLPPAIRKPAAIRGEMGQKNDLRKSLIPAAAPKTRKDQNEFMRKVSATPYKMTADEKKALASIREARANPSSGKVGAKIVGRKKVGVGKVGPKPPAPAPAAKPTPKPMGGGGGGGGGMGPGLSTLPKPRP